MNTLGKYIVRKGVEKASVAMPKDAIENDPTLTTETKIFWISFLNGVSITSDVVDIIKTLSGKRLENSD